MLSFLRSKFTLLKNKLFKKDALPLVAPHYDYKLLQKAQGRFWPRFSQLRQIQRILNRREKLTLWFAVLLFLVGFFWAGGNWVKAHRIEVPAVGGTVIEAVVGSPQFINPIFSSTNDVDADIGRLVYSGLMRYDEKGRLLPDLAVK